MTAYDKLREKLYSDSFTLEVLPRIRRQVRSSVITVASATVDVSQLLSLQTPLNGPGDGLLFERVTLSYQPPLSTAILTDAGIQASVVGVSDGLFSLKRARGTTTSTGVVFSSLGEVEEFDLGLGLFSSVDFNGMAGKAGAAANGTQILLTLAFTVFDVNAQTVPWQWDVWYRLVRGLQEN